MFKESGEEPMDDEMLAKLNEELGKMMRAQNESPDPELGGLSPDQVYRLVHSDWDSDRCPLKLRRDLAPEVYEASPFFCNTRHFLLAIQEAGGVKATATGNLPRKFVAEMIDVFLNAEEKEELFHFNKVVNEIDLFSLHLSRIISEGSGLIGKSKGRFVVRKKQQKLLAPENSGALFSELFQTYFREFNLAYADGIPCEAPSLQSTIAYSLQRIQSTGNDWQSIEDWTPSLLLPKILEDVEHELADRPYTGVSDLVRFRILSSLHEWGLVEFQNETGEYLDEMRTARKTPLFDQIVQFSF